MTVLLPLEGGRGSASCPAGGAVRWHHETRGDVMMTEDREMSCADRIGGQLESRADDVRRMLAAQSGERVCVHCGNVIAEETREINGELAWADESWDDDRAFQCGMAEDSRHAPDDEYTEDSLNDFGLSLSRKVLLRFDMSTGGPADWLELVCDEEVTGDRFGTLERGPLTLERVSYHFADWFDHAETPVDEGSPMWQLAEWIVEGQAQ